MATARRVSESSRPNQPPATTLEARENQMIALAVDAAEKQLRDGTASSQVITHFLKLATTRERLEQEKLSQEVERLRAQTKQIESGEKMEALYKDAISAMKSYAGYGSSDDDDY